MTLQPGTVLGGRYQLERQLGMGGMGTVFAAIDRSLQRPVALKLLNPEASRDPSQVSRFEQEARAIAALGHPHITALYDFHAAADPTPFLVMELVVGESLRGVLNRERQLAPQRAVALTLQMLSALGAAHAVGTIHRDVKPSNVMLVRDGGTERVKLVDFGVAKMAEGTTRHHQTAEGSVIGTVQYMPPEQARGLPVTPASDLYSVAVCLFEMLAGYNPFAVGELGAVFVAVRDLVPPDLRQIRTDVPEFVAHAVARTLAKDPAARFSSAAELAAALGGGGPSSHAGLALGPATYVGQGPLSSGVATYAGGAATRIDAAGGPAPYLGGLAPAAFTGPPGHAGSPVGQPAGRPTLLIAGLVLALVAMSAVAGTLLLLRPAAEPPPVAVVASASSVASLAPAASAPRATSASTEALASQPPPRSSTAAGKADKPTSPRPAPSDGGTAPAKVFQRCICNGLPPAPTGDGWLCRERTAAPACYCHEVGARNSNVCGIPYTLVGQTWKCADGSDQSHPVSGATNGGRCTGYTTDGTKISGQYDCSFCGAGYFPGNNGDACEGYHRPTGTKYRGQLAACD